MGRATEKNGETESEMISKPEIKTERDRWGERPRETHSRRGREAGDARETEAAKLEAEGDQVQSSPSHRHTPMHRHTHAHHFIQATRPEVRGAQALFVVLWAPMS